MIRLLINFIAVFSFGQEQQNVLTVVFFVCVVTKSLVMLQLGKVDLNSLNHSTHVFSYFDIRRSGLTRISQIPLMFQQTFNFLMSCQI
jgi:hypothetical protein